MKKDNSNLHRAKKAKNDEWFDIPGHLNYMIRKDGEIYFKGCKGIRRYRKPQMVKKFLGQIGYYMVHLDGKIQTLHRLLALTFIPNPNNKPEVDHIDGNRTNNDLSNLRWVTHKENLNNPVSVQREIESHTGKTSNIKGRVKVWIDKENKKYMMVCPNQIET